MKKWIKCKELIDVHVIDYIIKHRSRIMDIAAAHGVMSLWEHVIRDQNDNCMKCGVKKSKQVRIVLTGKKACDVYGFKFQ